MPVYRVPAPRSGLVYDPGGEFGGAATAESILLPEERVRDTGILDAQGQPIYRYPDPIGFRLR